MVGRKVENKVSHHGCSAAKVLPWVCQTVLRLSLVFQSGDFNNLYLIAGTPIRHYLGQDQYEAKQMKEEREREKSHILQ